MLILLIFLSVDILGLGKAPLVSLEIIFLVSVPDTRITLIPDIPELSEEVKNLNNPNDQNIFFQKMQKLMPGISFNKLK